MKHPLSLSALSTALFLTACASSPPPTPAGPAPSGPVSPTTANATPSEAPDPLDEKLRHCPLTVDTAKSELRDVDGGVELVVHVANADQVAELEKRVRHIEEFTQRDGKVGGRHGTGKGGGRMQNCPIVTQRTKVQGEKIELGFRIVVRATDAADVDSMRAETRKRLAALTIPAPATP